MQSVFKGLLWDVEDECWTGSVLFLGQHLKTLIDFDAVNFTETQKHSAVEMANDLTLRLTSTWESNCRDEAARQILDFVFCQSEVQATNEDRQKLTADMELDRLEFSYWCEENGILGSLTYTAQTCFPNNILQVNFLDDLSIDEVMVYSPRKT